MQIRVLGTVEAQVGDELVALGPRQRRLVLGVLAWEVNRLVPIDRLITLVWPESPPRSASHAIRVSVSDLRSRLPGIELETHGTGYLLRCDPMLVDVHRFLALVAEARKSDDDRQRLKILDEALGLWRGPVLADVAEDRTRDLLASGVEETRLAAVEDRVDALLRLGGHRDVVEELLGLVDANPTRERLVGQLMLAMYRGGRAGQALDVFRRTRAYLAEELGIDPGGELRRLELAILRNDDELDLPVIEPAAPLLVGRRHELAQLNEWRAKAMSGRTTVVLLEGPAGIGKSTLLDEFARGGKVLRGNGVAEEGAPAYWPWRQIFRQWLAAVEPTAAAETLGDAADKIARIAPELRRLAGRGAELPPATAEERFALFDQVTEFVTRMAADGLVIVIDDLHWADPASLLLFGHLARGVRAPLLLVGAFRPYELRQAPRGGEMVAEVTRLSGVNRLELSGLSADEVAQQLTAELGRPCDPDEAANVARRTGGNPLFVREIGRLGRTGPNDVPTGARDAIHQYLRVLSPSCRDLLTTASVLSTDIDPVALAAVADTSIDEVLNALDEAVAASVVDTGFRFAHDLVRDCLMLDLAAADRARIHLRAAEDLEVRNGHPAQIAHHRLQALPLGDPAQAARTATQAAELAMSQLAYEDAVRFYDEAIRANGGPDIDLLIGKAGALYFSYDVELADRTCEQAAELARRTGDAEGLARAALVRPEQTDPLWLDVIAPWCEQALAGLPEKDSVTRARLLALRAIHDVGAGEDNRAARAGDAALAMAERLGDPEALSAALWARQFVHGGPDGNHERLAIGARMIHLARRTDDRALVWGHMWRFAALMQLGRVPEADLELDLVEPVVARLDHPQGRWHLLRSRAAVLQGRGRFAEAKALMAEGIRVAERGRNPHGVAVTKLSLAYVGLLTELDTGPASGDVLDLGLGSRLMAVMSVGAVHVDIGQLDQAREIYQGLPPLAEVTKPAWFRLLILHQYGLMAAALGDVPTAETVYRELLPYSHLHVTTGGNVILTGGSLHAILGITATASGRTEDAVQHLRAAIAANAEAGLEPWVAEAHYRLALLLRDRADALRQAREAHAIATRLGMARLLTHTTELLSTYA